MLVLHGTLPENVDKIASGGFDERLARQGGLFGQGSYFTDESCKSGLVLNARVREQIPRINVMISAIVGLNN